MTSVSGWLCAREQCCGPMWTAPALSCVFLVPSMSALTSVIMGVVLLGHCWLCMCQGHRWVSLLACRLLADDFSPVPALASCRVAGDHGRGGRAAPGPRRTDRGFGQSWPSDLVIGGLACSALFPVLLVTTRRPVAVGLVYVCQNARTGVLFDYFAAPDDAVAATVIDVVGGPAEAGFPTVALKGVDPFV